MSVLKNTKKSFNTEKFESIHPLFSSLQNSCQLLIPFLPNSECLIVTEMDSETNPQEEFGVLLTHKLLLKL